MSEFQVPVPRTIITLAMAEVEEPKYSLQDPVLVVTDKSTSKTLGRLGVRFTCFTSMIVHRLFAVRN